MANTRLTTDAAAGADDGDQVAAMQAELAALRAENDALKESARKPPKGGSDEAEALAAELAKVRAENDGLRAAAGAAAPPARPTPRPPSFGMTEGERADLAQSGVTTSPFTGEQLNAHDAGVEPGNPVAKAAADRAQGRKRQAAERPVEG